MLEKRDIKKIVVLSLFDGISCGKLALERAGIKLEGYYASEIDKNAIKVAIYNNPDIIEIGDVTKVSYKSGVLFTENGEFNVGKIDLLIGGSPCTNFSSIGNSKGITCNDNKVLSLDDYLNLKSKGLKFDGQSYLFWEYVRLLKEVNPKYFLLENVVMAKEWQNLITENLGVEPIRINSSFLSAQNRLRLYWTNIKVEPIEDKGIILDDILDNNADVRDVSYCLTIQKSWDKLYNKYGYIPIKFNAYNISAIKDKACTLSRGSMITSSCATLLFTKVYNGVHIVKDKILDNKYPINLVDGEYNLRKLSLLEIERLQTLPDNYTKLDGLSDSCKSRMIGNGWTVDVIREIFKNII